MNLGLESYQSFPELKESNANEENEQKQIRVVGQDNEPRVT